MKYMIKRIWEKYAIIQEKLCWDFSTYYFKYLFSVPNVIEIGLGV